MSEAIQKAIDKMGESWNEYKAANDERLKQLESKGVVDPLITEKLSKLDAVLSDQEKIKTDLEEVTKKANRPAGKTTDSPENAEHKEAFGEYMRGNEKSDLRDIEQKALVGNVDPEGGFLMTHEMANDIDRILTQDVAMRRLAQIQQVGGTSYKKLVNIGGGSYRWAGETEESEESSTPKLRELEFNVHKLEAEPMVTADALEDSYMNMESWLTDEVTIDLTMGESVGFITGDGIKKPRGLLSYENVANDSYEWGKIGYTASGNASAFPASNPSDKLIDVVHSLKRGYRNGANWLMNDLTLAAIRKFKDGQGNYIWVPGLQEGIASSLLGYGVEIDDNMPDVEAGAFPISFGNFRRGYLIVDRRGMAVLTDRITKKGWVKYYTTRRVGGGVQNFEAIKLVKIATS